MANNTWGVDIQDNKLTKSESNTLIIGIIATVLCVLLGVNDLDILASIVTVFLALYSIQKSPIERLYLVFLSVPNTRAMEAFGVSGAVCICAVGSLILILKYHKLDKKIFCLLVLFLLYSMQYIIRFSDYTLGIVMPLKTIFVVLFFYLISDNELLYKKPLKVLYGASLYFFWGIVTAFFASILLNNNLGRFEVVNNDANMLSVEVAFLLSAFCVLFFRFNMLSQKKFITIAIILSIICVLCGSRTGLILLAIVLLTTVIFNIRKFSKMFLFAVILLIALIIFLISPLGRDVVSVLVYRSKALASQGNILNGRETIWNSYISIFEENKYLWLLGMGSYSYYGLTYMAHNFLLEDIALYGILGVMILYGAYIMIFKKVINNMLYEMGRSKTYLYALVPFIIPIIGGITLHGLTNIPNTVMLFWGAVIIAVGRVKIVL